MITTILTGLWTVIKNPFIQKVIIIFAVILALLMIGRYWGRTVIKRQLLTEELKGVKTYVEEKNRIDARYQQHFDLDRVLSGGASEHSKTCVPVDGVCPLPK